LSRFSKALPWLERVSGAVLVVLALVVLASMAVGLMSRIQLS